jgi:hypothetical protein
MNQPPSSARTFLLDGLALFLLTALLIWPLFKVKYMDRWESIESTFIADARFLRDHWPHPRWQPLWYGGTRVDYVYPPALRYGTAGLTKLYPPLLPVRAYHIYTAFFYCLGIVGVYLFVRMGSGSRGAAWLAAAAAALLSPSFLLMPDYRRDSGFLAPVRLWVLTRYGEGPHMTAFALLPIALAAGRRALEQSRPLAFALTAVVCALLVSNNFYGGTALALLFPLLVWCQWVTQRDHRIWWRALGIAALAYGLTAFWLVPSYFRITLQNLQFVSEAGNVWSRWVALAVVVLFMVITNRIARGRSEMAYPLFVWGAFLFLTLNVLGNYYFRFRVTGEPQRLVPEMDLAMILLAVEGLRLLWRHSLAARICAVALVLICFGAARRYPRHAWSIYPWYPAFQDRLEYRITDWIAKNLPDARLLATGTVRFWYNTWHDLAQMDGGSDQGIVNPFVMTAQYQILYGESVEPAIHWMQSFGIDAAIVHERKADVLYNDYTFPEKFAGVLPVLYDDRKGNLIYAVPRRFPGLARVVEKAKVESLRPVQSQEDHENIRAYAQVVEQGPDSPASTAWEGTDVLRLRARLNTGELLSVLVSYDPGWRAYSDGRALRVRRDLLGQMLIEAPPGNHDIRLVFELPLEYHIGRIASAASGLVVIGLVVAGRRRRKEPA